MPLFLTFGLAANAVAAGQSSASYNLTVNTIDGGGLRATSVSYSNDGSVSSFGGLVTSRTPVESNRTGYAGQLYEVKAFTLSASSTNLNEGASMELSCVQFLDDGTVSIANGYAYWTFTGPIERVNPSGIVTAAFVEQNTPGVVEASFEGWSASLNLLVIYVGASPGYNIVTDQLLSGGNVRLSFQGSNGIDYALDRCYNLRPPICWMPQETNTAALNGLLIFTNQADPATNNFWRVRVIP